jgi:hypothetical protein
LPAEVVVDPVVVAAVDPVVVVDPVAVAVACAPVATAASAMPEPALTAVRPNQQVAGATTQELVLAQVEPGDLP